MPNIFQDSTKSIPKSDKQIVRVRMTDMDIAARKDHMPKDTKSGDMDIQHVPNAGTRG